MCALRVIILRAQGLKLDGGSSRSGWLSRTGASSSTLDGTAAIAVRAELSGGEPYIRGDVQASGVYDIAKDDSGELEPIVLQTAAAQCSQQASDIVWSERQSMLFRLMGGALPSEMVAFSVLLQIEHCHTSGTLDAISPYPLLRVVP